MGEYLVIVELACGSTFMDRKNRALETWADRFLFPETQMAALQTAQTPPAMSPARACSTTTVAPPLSIQEARLSV